MIGAMIGDYAGSYSEEMALLGSQVKSYNLQINGARFRVTDDSILLTAVAETLMGVADFGQKYRAWYNKYPDYGFSKLFTLWALKSEYEQTNGHSYGNEASSRSGLIGYLKDENQVLEVARKSAVCTHDSQEGIAGAKAMAWTVWALRNHVSIPEIKKQLYSEFDYYIDYDAKLLQKEMTFDSSAVNTVPIAIWIALDAKSFIDAIRMCLFIGGDTDTIGAMAGLLAQQRFGVDPDLEFTVRHYLHTRMKPLAKVLQNFEMVIEQNGYLPEPLWLK